MGTDVGWKKIFLHQVKNTFNSTVFKSTYSREEENTLVSFLDRFNVFHPGITNCGIDLTIDDIKVGGKTLLTHYYKKKEIRICTILIWRGADFNKISAEPLYHDYYDYFVLLTTL